MSRTRRNRSEAGATLVPALLMSMLLMAASAELTSNALHRYAAERQRSEESLAAHMAESGLDVGLYELQTGSDLAADGIGANSGLLAGGSYTTSISPAYSGAAGSPYTLTSIGRVGQRRATLQMVVIASVSAGLGIIGLDSLSLSGAAQVDSYDATLGSYASQVKSGHASSLGSVESNGDVSAQGSGAIYGNATPGPAKKFTGNFTVSGTTAPAKTSIAVPAYEYTPVGTAKGSYSGSATLTAGTYRYTSFSMKATDALTLQGDVTIYVDGSIELAGQASIKLASGAKLSLNQGSGTLSIAGGGVVNASQKPANLQINTATSSAVKVEGTSAFYGTVLAPDAPFTRDGTADFFGAIVAKSATLVGTGWMHYDSSLAGGGAPTFKVALVRGW